MNEGQTNSPVEDVDFIRQFAVTEEGKPKYPAVVTASNVVSLDEYRCRRLVSKFTPQPNGHPPI
jgi:hypothetical protein